MDTPSFEDEARDEWRRDYKGSITDAHLLIGCLQRIGTALERIVAAIEKKDLEVKLSVGKKENPPC